MSTDEQRAREVTVSIIAEIAEVEQSKIHGSDRLREDLGMDSLSALEFLSSLGEKLRVDFEIEAAMDIRTVDDACAFVARQCAAVGA